MKKKFKQLLFLCIGTVFFVFTACNNDLSPKLNTYTITFNANNGTNETATQTFTEGMPQTFNTVEELGFSYRGHKFLGWASYSYATSASYSDGEEYTATRDITLYAIWKFDALKTGDKINAILQQFPDATSFKQAASSISETPDYYLDEAENIPVWYESSSKTIYYYSNNSELLLNPNSAQMFEDLQNITEIDVTNFDTSMVTYMSYMFSGCKSLTILDVSNFNTSNVTSMSYMFDGCESLTSLDVTNFDTSKVTGMSGMFYGCKSLTSLDVSNFDTSKVTYMG